MPTRAFSRHWTLLRCKHFGGKSAYFSCLDLSISVSSKSEYLGEDGAWGPWQSSGCEATNGQDTSCQICLISLVLSRPWPVSVSLTSCRHQDNRCLVRTSELVFLLSSSTTRPWKITFWWVLKTWHSTTQGKGWGLRKNLTLNIPYWPVIFHPQRCSGSGVSRQCSAGADHYRLMYSHVAGLRIVGSKY